MARFVDLFKKKSGNYVFAITTGVSGGSALEHPMNLAMALQMLDTIRVYYPSVAVTVYYAKWPKGYWQQYTHSYANPAYQKLVSSFV